MKAQTEIIGLVFIVVLLLFSGIIYLSLSSNKQDNLSDLRTNVRTSNLLSSMVKLTVNGKNFQDHLVDCKTENKCDDLETEIPKIIAASGLQKNQKYELKITSDNQNIVNLGGCDTGITSSFPVIRQGINFDVSLKVCSVE